MKTTSEQGPNTITICCKECKKNFWVESRKGSGSKRKYCSVECKRRVDYYRNYYKKLGEPSNNRICLCCEKSFLVGRGLVGGYSRRKYCSHKCKEKTMLARARQKRKDNPIPYNSEKRKAGYLATKADPVLLEKHRESGRTGKAKVRNFLAEYKMERGCVDCGYKEHWSALQLDHEGYKSVSIAEARSSPARLLAEIAAGQCVVRCANCHSVITWKRKMGLA